MLRVQHVSTLYFEAHDGCYLDALAHVDDLTPAIGALDALTSRAATADGRTVRPFNPVARQDARCSRC